MAPVDKNLLDLLPAYGKGELDTDQTIDVEALITGYLDGLLDPETEAAIDRLIETHTGLAEEIEKASAGKDILAELLPPVEGLLENPGSPAIQGFLDDLYAKAARTDEPEANTSDEETIAANDNIAQSPARSWFHPIAYGVAASILLAVIAGSSWLLTTKQRDLDVARRQQVELQFEVERFQVREATKEARLDALDGLVKQLGTKLVTTETERDQLVSDGIQQTAEIAGLEAALDKADQRLDGLRAERAELAGAVDRLSLQMETSAEARDAAETALADAQNEQVPLRTEITRLGDELSKSSDAHQTLLADLAEAERAHTTVEQALAEAEAGQASTVEALQEQRARLERRITGLALDADAKATELENRQRELASLEERLDRRGADLADAGQQIAEQALERAKLERSLADHRNREEWTYQVAQYHTIFADQPKRRWVDAGADEPKRLTTLLADLSTGLGLDEPLSLPTELTDAGFEFMGARQLVINGRPVAQLVYADQQKQLFAFCITRNGSSKARDIKRHRVNDDLHLADWKDQNFSYVVVGYEPLAIVKGFAEQIKESYWL